jgi:hypothetical protein
MIQKLDPKKVYKRNELILKINEIIDHLHKDEFSLMNFDLKFLYNQAIEALKAYGICVSSAPKFELIQSKLNSYKFSKINKFEKSILLLIPPVPRKDLLAAINKNNNIGNLQYDCYTYSFDDDSLWGKDSNEWRVMITEDMKDIQKKFSGTWKKQAESFLEDAKEKGIDLINDAQSYLVLLMIMQKQNINIETDYFCVLNADRLTNSSYVAYSVFRADIRRVVFYGSNPVYASEDLRARPSVPLL